MIWIKISNGKFNDAAKLFVFNLIDSAVKIVVLWIDLVAFSFTKLNV